MDNNRDEALNTLTILDETMATYNNASIITNGGMLVRKNLVADEVNADFISTNKCKICDTISVHKNILTDGNILPLSRMSQAHLGTSEKKWNSIDTVNITVQQLLSINSMLRNATVENLHLSTCIATIDDDGGTNYELCLDDIVNFVTIEKELVNDIIHIRILDPPIGSHHDYKKIIFTQQVSNTIEWILGNKTIVNSGLKQVFEVINIRGKWEPIEYKYDTIRQDMSINNIMSDISGINNAIVDISNQIHFITTYNNFTDNSGNNLINFIDSINNFTDSESKVIDLSNNLNTFKTMCNNSFNSILTSIRTLENKVNTLIAKTDEIIIENNNCKELIDLLDKRLIDTTCHFENKNKYFTTKIKRLEDAIELILNRNSGIC